MSVTQQLDTLTRETKITLATKLCKIVAQHQTPTDHPNYQPYTTLHDDIQECFLLLDVIHKFIMTHSQTLPPQIAQNGRKTLSTLKATIIEVNDLLAPPPVFDVNVVWQQTLDGVDHSKEMDIINNKEKSDEVTSTSTTANTDPSSNNNPSTNTLEKTGYSYDNINNTTRNTTSNTQSKDDIRQHIISKLNNALVYILTLQQLYDLISSTTPNNADDSRNILATTDSSLKEKDKSALLTHLPSYKPNSLISLNPTQTSSSTFEQAINTMFDMQSKTIAHLHSLLDRSDRTSTLTSEIPSTSPQLYLYICDLSANYTSQVTDLATLQPPLLLKNLNNTTIIQYGAHSAMRSFTKYPTKPFSFASVTVQNITNSTLLLPLVDSSLHITKMERCLVIGHCHQLRLHFIKNSLFSTSKITTIPCASSLMSQLRQLVIEGDLHHNSNNSDSSNKNGIVVDTVEVIENTAPDGEEMNEEDILTPFEKCLETIHLGDRLEPIIENSQDTIFTPYPIISPVFLQENAVGFKIEQSEEQDKNDNNTTKNTNPNDVLRQIRSKLLTVFDFDSHLDHKEQSAPAGPMKPAPVTDGNNDDDDNAAVQKLHYSYLDQHIDALDVSSILNDLWVLTAQ